MFYNVPPDPFYYPAYHWDSHSKSRFSCSDNPEALDSLAEQELYVQIDCEKTSHVTGHKHGVTWNEQFTFYLVSPVTSVLNVKVIVCLELHILLLN